jgi:hypothetical protein
MIGESEHAKHRFGLGVRVDVPGRNSIEKSSRLVLELKLVDIKEILYLGSGPGIATAMVAARSSTSKSGNY